MSNNTNRRSRHLLESNTQPLEEEEKNKKPRIDDNTSSSSQKEKTLSDYELLKSRNQFNFNKIKTNFSGAILVDVDLRNTYLADLDFRGADFTKSDLTGAVFFNSDLREAVFDETIFDGTYFAGADLSDLHFINNTMISCYFNFNKKIKFSRSSSSQRNIFDYPEDKEKLPILDNIIFENVNLSRSVFDYNTFINVRFLSGYLYDTSFNYSKFINTTFVDDGREREADTFLLGFTFFIEASFYKNINLDLFEEGEEDLTFANINSLIINCVFSKAVLNCMCFRDLTIIDTNFEGCNLKFSTFEKSKLDDVRFQSSDDDIIVTLESINFKEAVMRYINFRNVRLSKINFRETIIRDTIFEDSIFLEDISFESSRLFDVDFTNATIQGNTNFNRAILTDIVFTNATFQVNTSFEGATLNNVDFIDAHFNDNVSFEGATLINTNTGTIREDIIDDDDNEQQQPLGRGRDFEIHDEFERKFEPIIPRFIELINQPDVVFSSRNKLNTFINDWFTTNINRLYSNNLTEIAEKLRKLELVKTQVFGYIRTNISDNTADLINKSLSFVGQQDDDFKKEYIISVLNDSCAAHEVDEWNPSGTVLSCPKGIVERFMLAIGTTLNVICIGGGCDDNETYKDLNILLNPPIDISALANKWWEEWAEKEEITRLSVEERKKKCIADLIAEARQITGYYPRINNEIATYVNDTIGYAFENMRLGGGNKRTKWGKRRATKKNVIFKQNKRRKITKKINGKRQRKSKRYNSKSKKNNRKTKRRNLHN